MGIHNLDFHRSALQPLASEVERVDVDCSIPTLHYSGDELVGAQRFIDPREYLPHRLQIAA